MDYQAFQRRSFSSMLSALYAIGCPSIQNFVKLLHSRSSSIFFRDLQQLEFLHPLSFLKSSQNPRYLPGASVLYPVSFAIRSCHANSAILTIAFLIHFDHTLRKASLTGASVYLRLTPGSSASRNPIRHQLQQGAVWTAG